MSKLSEKLEKYLLTNTWNNEDLVQIIEVCSDYLNLKTVQQFADENNMSYNGTLCQKGKIKICGKLFIFDNE